jgi:hypothetical protein
MRIREKTNDSQPELVPTAAVAVVEPPKHEVAHKPSNNTFTVGGITGEIDKGDLSMPKINIVQSVGPLSEDFKPGSILFRKELVLVQASDDPKAWTPPLEITVLSARKQFQEVKDYDSDEMGATVDTMAEVEAAGGWIDWRNDEKPPWRPLLTALCLVKAPTEEIAEQFTLAGPDDNSYELALWVMTGTAYTRAAKQIMTAAISSLKDKDTGQTMLPRGRWHLSVKRDKLGANLVYVPKFVLVGKHDDAFVEFASTLL